MNPFDSLMAWKPPAPNFAPQMPLLDFGNIGPIPTTLQPLSGRAPVPSFGWADALQFANQLSQQQQQQQQQQLIQPPGLFMPNIQIQPYQLPQLTAISGLAGGY